MNPSAAKHDGGPAVDSQCVIGCSLDEASILPASFAVEEETFDNPLADHNLLTFEVEAVL